MAETAAALTVMVAGSETAWPCASTRVSVCVPGSVPAGIVTVPDAVPSDDAVTDPTSVGVECRITRYVAPGVRPAARKATVPPAVGADPPGSAIAASPAVTRYVRVVRPSAAVTVTVTVRPSTATDDVADPSAVVTRTSPAARAGRPTGTTAPVDPAASPSGTVTPPTVMEAAAASSETRSCARRAVISWSSTPSVVRM
ncbi:hypothetical protein CMMCAS03_04640 [Clavibacter michiganensis subsp. michiganensis]|nr:hypothetical protein CMMCAS03_04640 [Clavibacter michiganensis subsp. michiganensis]OUE05335.1 hypothetical protein CMMCAS04_00240 [Clavibacter michiganensis subsp. michiganensis]